MEVNEQTVTLRVLTASSGHFLTQREAVAVQDRIVTEKIYLGVNDSADNWKEITEGEAAEIKAAQEELPGRQVTAAMPGPMSGGEESESSEGSEDSEDSEDSDRCPEGL